MTKRQAERILREWQAFLGLQGWQIEVVWHDELSPDHIGQAQMVSDLRYADIHLYTPHLSEPGKLEIVIIHELIHILVHPLCMTFLGQDSMDEGRLQYEHGELEYLVETLARRFYVLKPVKKPLRWPGLMRDGEPLATKQKPHRRLGRSRTSD